MSREILFRGKRIDNGEWVVGFIFKDVNNRWFIIPILDLPCPAFGTYNGDSITSNVFGHMQLHKRIGCFEVDLSTVCQYIGLTDKNGVKIFEGDILNENGCLFVVVYEQKWVKFKLQHERKAIQYPEWNRGILMDVIGNIFDNPELLKSES